MPRRGEDKIVRMCLSARGSVRGKVSGGLMDEKFKVQLGSAQYKLAGGIYDSAKEALRIGGKRQSRE